MTGSFEAGCPIAEVNTGGGLGVAFRPGDQPLDLDAWATALSRQLAPLGIVVGTEPGEFLVKGFAVHLAEVVTVEDRDGVTFVGLDTGWNVVVVYALRFFYIAVPASVPLLVLLEGFRGPMMTPVQISVVPRPGVSLDDAMGEVERIMRIRHNLRLDEPNDFNLVTQNAVVRLWNQVSQATFLALVVISSISLMVGGIGIMTMNVRVTERTREIGVRRALGARRREVLYQFLTEAAVLTSIGGVLGVLLGSVVGYGVHFLTGFPVSLPFWSFALGLGFSAIVGIGFGMYPAIRAAGLIPSKVLVHDVPSGVEPHERRRPFTRSSTVTTSARVQPRNASTRNSPGSVPTTTPAARAAGKEQAAQASEVERAHPPAGRATPRPPPVFTSAMGQAEPPEA